MKRKMKKNKETKLQTRENLGLYIDSDIFNGPLEDVAARITGLTDRLLKENANYAFNPKAYARVEMDVSIDGGNHYDSGASIEVTLYGVRIETDEAFEARMEIAAEEREYQTFLRLQKKFEKAKK